MDEQVDEDRIGHVSDSGGKEMPVDGPHAKLQTGGGWCAREILAGGLSTIMEPQAVS